MTSTDRVATLVATRPQVRFGPDGLAPAIVQDPSDGRVLMLGYVDAEALDATIETGEVHFHSRSRNRLWRKGETSGHVLRLLDLELDCDSDALLLTVEPVGPTCHRGTRSCFDDPTTASRNGTAVQGFAWLESLWSTIDKRATERPEGSYTVRLLEGGVDAVGRKVTEEATEVLLAAKDDAAAEGLGEDRDSTRTALASEAADLVYHLLVALRERDVEPATVFAALRERHAP